MNNIELIRQNALATNVVVVDGFSGSGKSLVLPLLCHMHNSELWQITGAAERIAILDIFNNVERKSAEAMIQLSFDERLYELQVARNVNFREFDDSSVQNNLMYEKYKARINNSREKEYIFERIKKEQPLYVTDVHYLFGYTDIYFKALFDRLEAYIIMLRNPTHLIKAFFAQDSLRRIISDPLHMSICIKDKELAVPYFAIDFLDEYWLSNDLEKTILFVYHHGKRVKKMYDGLSIKEKEKIIFMPFENLVLDHNKYIDIFQKKSGRKRSSTFESIEKHLKLPRDDKEIDFNVINQLKEERGIVVAEKYDRMIEEMIEEYKKILKKY